MFRREHPALGVLYMMQINAATVFIRLFRSKIPKPGLLKVVTNEKRGESRSWQVFEDGTRTVAIDVCLLFNVAVVFS
jgi:hypothetical protein